MMGGLGTLSQCGDVSSLTGNSSALMVASVGERNGGEGVFGKLDNWMSVSCLRFSEPTACGKQIVFV